MSISLPLQKAVFARLSSDATLSSLISGVYDIAPPSAAYPYVLIGEDDITDASSKTSRGFSVLLRLEVWSTAMGRSPGKSIEKELYRLLHQASFSVTGFTLVDCRFESSESSLEESARLFRTVVRFRVVVFVSGEW
ncbi:MAG: DUF3168 domain-containing protein [Holosporales bacterium]|jgi:hypothetical protein